MTEQDPRALAKQCLAEYSDPDGYAHPLARAVMELSERYNCCHGQHAEDCANYTGPSRAELDNVQDDNATLRAEVERLEDCCGLQGSRASTAEQVRDACLHIINAVEEAAGLIPGTTRDGELAQHVERLRGALEAQAVAWENLYEAMQPLDFERANELRGYCLLQRNAARAALGETGEIRDKDGKAVKVGLKVEGDVAVPYLIEADETEKP